MRWQRLKTAALRQLSDKFDGPRKSTTSCKILTLFHPATGQVYLHPATSCTNSVLHGWLKTELTAILARLPIPKEPVVAAETQAAWPVCQDGLTTPFTSPNRLPPLRLLLVWDNLAA